MNTVKKGDAFEDRVFNLLEPLLKQGKLGILPDSKIYKKKCYKKSSGTSIIIDISIETTLPNADTYSYLTLIECKDYGTPISVTKLRDFAYRIQELGAHKGVFITTSRFQSGAIEIAKEHRITLVRVNPDDSLNWELYRIGKKRFELQRTVVNDLCGENFNKQTLIIEEDKYYTSLIDYFIEILCLSPTIMTTGIPFLSNDQLKRRALDFLGSKLYTKVPSFDIIHLAKLQGVKFNFESDCNGLLGYCDFKNNVIYISNQLELDSPRWRFTLAHEIGHYLLHKELLKKHFISQANDVDIEIFGKSSNWENILEIQANKFASYLLLPHKIFLCKYLEVLYKLGVRNCPTLYLDNQSINVYNCSIVFYTLSRLFNVSEQVVKYRLKTEDLLVEQDMCHLDKYTRSRTF